MQTLVLDVGFQPIGTVPWERAITLFYENKVEIVKEYEDQWIHSAYLKMKVPSVIRFIKSIVKKMRKVKFSRDNVYVRDKGKCQYCDIKIERNSFTIDHVIPRAKGGTTCFENVVIACVDCNRLKADKTVKEAGMKLKTEPVRPKSLFLSFNWLPLTTFHDSWRDFLYWHQELKED